MKGIIEDEYVLRPEYLPDKIPHREEHLKGILSHFSTFFKTGEHSVAMVLTGPVGSGKTMLAKKLYAEGQKVSKRSGTLMKLCMTNARVDRGPSLFVNRLLRCIGLDLPTRGYDPMEILTLTLEDLSMNRYSLFLIIDEADTFVELVNPDILYSLARSSEFGGPPVSILLISKRRDLLGVLDKSLQSTLSVGRMDLKGYTASELFDILKDRARLAFTPGSISDHVVDVIAERASKFGDARLAIDLLYRAGKLAELDGGERVLLEHVERAYEEIRPPVDLSALRELDEKERKVLKIIAQLSMVDGSASMGSIKGALNELSYTALWMTVKILEAKGLVELKRTKLGRGWTSIVSPTMKPRFILDILEGESNGGTWLKAKD